MVYSFPIQHYVQRTFYCVQLQPESAPALNTPPYLVKTDFDFFSPIHSSQAPLQDGVPFTVEQATAYIQSEWSRLGLGNVPTPNIIQIKEGDTPCYSGNNSFSWDDWEAMKPTPLLSKAGTKIVLDEPGKLSVVANNAILLPEEVLTKGRFAILAHEINHATKYPKIVAAMLAGKLSPNAGEEIPADYILKIKQAGLDQNANFVNEGIYRAKLMSDSGSYGPSLVSLNQKLDQMEATQTTPSFDYIKALQEYKFALAKYISSQEELEGMVLYAQLKKEPVLTPIFEGLLNSLTQGNRENFSQYIDQLCEYGISEGHLKGRKLPSLKPFEIDSIFDEWATNLRLSQQLNLTPFDLGNR